MTQEPRPPHDRTECLRPRSVFVSPGEGIDKCDTPPSKNFAPKTRSQFIEIDQVLHQLHDALPPALTVTQKAVGYLQLPRLSL